MRRIIVRRAAALGVCLLAACGGDAAETATTRSTTQDLLAQVAPTSDGGQRQLVQEAPQIDVALLGHNRGSVDAPVKVVEMSDFGCGYCRKFHEETFPVLFEEFIESGMVEWKFMPFITGMFDNSIAATEAAECALEQSEALFVDLSDRLWVGQSDWKQSTQPEAVVRGMAEQAGVDLDTLDSCLAEDRQMDRVAGSTGLAQRLAVRGTPTFFIGGYAPVQGALPVELFQDILRTAHNEATKGAGG